MTDRDVVERVGRLLERAVIPLSTRAPHHKRPYAVTIKGTAAVRLMVSLRPELGIARNEQIAKALEQWGLKRVRWRYSGLTCTWQGCESPATTRGLCDRHYNHWYKAVTRGRPTDVSLGPVPSAEILAAAPTRSHGELCQISWLAGLLEGEGCFAIARTNGHAYPVIELQMCDEDVVRRAAEMLRAVSVSRREPDEEHWSPTFTAKIAGHAAASWMLRLWLLMGIRRGAAIDAALAAYDPIRLVEPPEACVVPGCGAPHRSRGLCHKHYMSWSRDVARGRVPRITPLR